MRICDFSTSGLHYSALFSVFDVRLVFLPSWETVTPYRSSEMFTFVDDGCRGALNPWGRANPIPPELINAPRD